MLPSLSTETDSDHAVAGDTAANLTEPFPAMVARMAVESLVAEANLTPKPGLVDARGAGAHADLDLELMHRSAHSLFPCFQEMAIAMKGMAPSQEARECLAVIGRAGEVAMFEATAGINTHKGAIWALGLLVAGSVLCAYPFNPVEIASIAGAIARHRDTRVPVETTNGSKVTERYGVLGARGEARDGFPHVVKVGLPVLRSARSRGVTETNARLDALLAIMAELDDTCLLHRGGLTALETAKAGAANILQLGGTSKNGKKRPIITVIDSKSQAYGRREELSGIHLAAAAIIAAYADARMAGHPVIALIVGRCVSGSFLALAGQANRMIAFNDPEVLVHAMYKDAAARITRRSVDELDKLGEQIVPMAYDIGSFNKLGGLHALIDVASPDEPTGETINQVKQVLIGAIAEARQSSRSLDVRLESKGAKAFRNASLLVRQKMMEQWAAK